MVNLFSVGLESPNFGLIKMDPEFLVVGMDEFITRPLSQLYLEFIELTEIAEAEAASIGTSIAVPSVSTEVTDISVQESNGPIEPFIVNYNCRWWPLTRCFK